MADFLTGLGDMLGLNKGKATITAADKNRDVLTGMDTRIGNTITAGDKQARGYLQNSADLASLGPNADGIMGDIYGLNGTAGHDKALDMFHTGPGYDFQMDQGLQALDRRRAAAGSFQSGGADLDTLRFSQGLADQSWNDWVNGISSGIDRSIHTNGDLATLTGNTTGQRIGLAEGIGSGNMNVNNQEAAGAEAGQGAIWDVVGNVAGAAGSLFGLNKGGMPGSGAVPAGAAAAGGAAAAPAPAFYGYGRF